MKLYPKITASINQLDFKNLPVPRKLVLQPLIDFIQTKVNLSQPIQLNYICTHNSRRSHLAQIWSQTAAAYFNVSNTNCFSGGTETTAIYPIIISTLEEAGFEVARITNDRNPRYKISYSPTESSIIGFSKRFDDSINPGENFAAILTCSEADDACPFISGAEKRIAIPYDDPKIFDDSPLQCEKYRQRSKQIATDMFYVFSQINY